MRNLMDEYIDFTSKKIKKYVRMILRSKYDEKIVQEFLRTYINSRYYNINEESSRPFYLKITDELNKKQKILNEKDEEGKELIIEVTKQIFVYMLFFDNVRKVENFKNIKSIKEVINQLIDYCQKTLGIKMQDDIHEALYNEITTDMLDKDIYLDKFETDNFILDFEKTKELDNVYYTRLDYNMRLPMQYSYEAVEKVYNTGTVAENKLAVEYVLLSVVAIRDVLNGNFKDKYIVEFSNSLIKKEQKLDGLLAILTNQALQDKINITISYRDFQKNRDMILEFIGKGYNFAIELDDYLEDVEIIKKLKMFKFIIVPSNIKLYKEAIKYKKQFANILEK